MKTLTICAAIAALAFGTTGAIAAGDMSGMDTSGTQSAATAAKPGGMLGAHAMPATVTRVDYKTGMVYVTSLGMKMAVHFPPPTIRGLKVGDKILLHLSFSYAG